MLINEVEGFHQHSFPHAVCRRNLFCKLQQNEDLSMYLSFYSCKHKKFMEILLKQLKETAPKFENETETKNIKTACHIVYTRNLT